MSLLVPSFLLLIDDSFLFPARSEHGATVGVIGGAGRINGNDTLGLTLTS